MSRGRLVKIGMLLAIVALLAMAVLTAMPALAADSRHHQVTIPADDRFSPYSLTIHAGDTVTWVNKDTDDHTVVSDNAFNTSDHRGVNMLLPGTDNNKGKPGTLTLRFDRAGTFVYYCRFHSHLDSFNQPTAPGPDGGIQGPNGNFGTPMTGVIFVLPDRR
jgi:plastocyanin